ncbi:uncharacterized protein TNIN_371421 [Trichonephila inaurata madagascariensis]|uniref:Uncharacterized protein n=1 Tax=Trichonephila inaurata madagascariensis TaxID=2747483 RepID=A0A8X7C2F0_9ARAC|nr:uncharacterized protein TNIN_371421 [Trichonephila inaurata madagascariensis]
MRIKREIKVVLIFSICLLIANVIEARIIPTIPTKKVYVLSNLAQPFTRSLQAQPKISKNKKPRFMSLPIISSAEGCPKGYKYDPFFKKCRKLVCAIPGYKMINGKCVKPS